ncbi:fucolectin-like [Pleurodeles waltl]|uniref:fucolectin-like n=1 Tax=Pleurodeles waltl TaxID=8319 RepID=UPI003709A287
METALILLLGILITIQASESAKCKECEKCRPPATGKNLAPEGKAQQSSTHTKFRWATANLAIDGNIDTDARRLSCSITSMQKDPWWQLNLWRMIKIKAIVFYGRTNCCENSYIGAQIRVGLDIPGHESLVIQRFKDFTPHGRIAICVRAVWANYIRIEIIGRRDRLSVCEVEIYG